MQAKGLVFLKENSLIKMELYKSSEEICESIATPNKIENQETKAHCLPNTKGSSPISGYISVRVKST